MGKGGTKSLTKLKLSLHLLTKTKMRDLHILLVAGITSLAFVLLLHVLSQYLTSVTPIV